MSTLHFILNVITALSVVLIYITPHPIYSVLLLVFLFCQAAATMFLFGIEFLSLLFIIVYVGAIAVLFLFVVMMLNIKVYKQNISQNLLFFSIIGGFFMAFFFKIINNVLVNFDLTNELNFSKFDLNSFDFLTNLDIIGQLLLSDYAFHLVIAGLLLLVPLIGAIVLTFNYNSVQKSNVVARQLSRSATTTSFLK